MGGLTYDTHIGPAAGLTAPLHRALARLDLARVRATRNNARFTFGGRELPYFVAMFNQTWVNERCVELAIVEAEMPSDGRILEIGNVWAHYKKHGHVVVDKYEVAEGVRNIDIVAIPDEVRYDFIFSVSTLEHVGWDEDPREPGKFAQAYKKVRSLLAPGGTAIVTFSVGWNGWLDDALRDGDIEAERIDWYLRVGRNCDWKLSDRDTVLGQRYGEPFNNANGLVVLTIKAS